MGKKSSRNKEKTVTHRWGSYVVQGILVVYGIYACLKRGFADYLFMKVMFAFYDFSEPVVWFPVDYVAVTVMFAIAGYHHMRLIRRQESGHDSSQRIGS